MSVIVISNFDRVGVRSTRHSHRTKLQLGTSQIISVDQRSKVIHERSKVIHGLQIIEFTDGG